MRHKTTQAVLDYFNLVRNCESAPLRADIDPRGLKSVLPDVFILKTGETGGFPFRLAGTRVCAILGQEARGRDLLSYFAPAQRHKMKLAVESVLANRTPLVIDINGIGEDATAHAYEMLLLPLRSSGTLCDRLFGSIVCLDHTQRDDQSGHQLEAIHLTFLRDEPSGVAADPLANIAISSPQPENAARVFQLRLLPGGRRD